MAANRWFIDSETGVLTDVLLCPPDYYEWIPSNDIAIQTMAGGGSIDRNVLSSQFNELVSTLKGADVSCHFLTPHKGMPYEVYTRDSSQTTPFGTVVTNLSRPERVGEEKEIRTFYAPDEIWRTCTAGRIEGGDIHIIRPGLLAVGVSGGRTDIKGAAEFINWFEEAGWTCRMIHFPEHFLHLDVIFCMVAENLAIAAVDVLDEADLEWFRAQGIRILPVTYREAMRDMGCNVLALGRDRVVSPRHSTRINAMLRAEGLSVLDPELNQFSRGGGSIHCMTMPLRRQSLQTA
ncbi:MULTISPECIES: dimethylarginine dimethylaminohydrolase family protein [Acetobacter]|jgi:N-dimethylarginine dimethylaminohydrolase|uniref:arginine deiminase n=1 Tax=Acetobacter lovaniensis TaxID=104100 RepID=A0A841QCU6_9PROT|nr:arginine deiminase family protein [Acetobacter lovaniensis]MBB6456669.1 N-dimethylarginine dimethylaminohydrolase [Acetobacter lovaniensis]MCI1795465.1 arginine deiminase family protein [Acetobacter lovaniensis]MCP1239256.1 arginine deiminase family protein [Acetobacter lovaniensis]NHN81511.1 arginine deiminase [Acetobacter lovaniensis]GBQ65448.1 amidinotransferase [Acetobacter lovaniensis NRIC 0474]